MREAEKKKAEKEAAKAKKAAEKAAAEAAAEEAPADGGETDEGSRRKGTAILTSMDLRARSSTACSRCWPGRRRAGAWWPRARGSVAFGLFAFLTVGGALVCVWERSVVRSAFSLMATFSGTAGLFLLLGADFLAMAQILIYVGGILALMLFGVMLTPPDLTERKLPRVVSGAWPSSARSAWPSWPPGRRHGDLGPGRRAARARQPRRADRRRLPGPDQYVVAVRAGGGPPDGRPGRGRLHRAP